MPTYLYQCPNHGEFEEFHSMSEEARLKECPNCRKEKNIEVTVIRLINSQARGVVELTGLELNEKIKSDAASFKRDVYNSEKLYSNVLGEGNYEKVQQRMDRQKRR